MSISIYKPNSKNSGSGFSFQMGVDTKSKEPALFIKSILQHSWDSEKKQGYFKDNLDNPDKNITVRIVNDFSDSPAKNQRKRIHYGYYKY